MIAHGLSHPTLTPTPVLQPRLMPPKPHRIIDIAVNSTDDMFIGLYRGKQKHVPDFSAVIARAALAGVDAMILTGGSLEESKLAYQHAAAYGLYSTVGLHPTRTHEMDADPQSYLSQLDGVIAGGLAHKKGKGRVVAIGECGLDYDRLHFSPKEMQLTHFASQLYLSKKHGLPLFLHSRAAHGDLIKILREHKADWEDQGGVVHSFTGTLIEMQELVAEGLFIGLNGCSLKTEENLSVAAAVPLERLMLETDAPWCSLTTSHASHRHLVNLPSDLAALYGPPQVAPEKFTDGKGVKGRMEPCGVGRVAWVVAQAKGISMEEVCSFAYDNTIKLFGLEDDTER